MMEEGDKISKLKKLIKDRLTWDNRIDISQIEIYIQDDVVTLKGCVSTYPEKILAEIETQLVPGVKSVVNDIEVKFPDSFELRSDQDVEEAMFCLLDSNSELDSSEVQVSIKNGVVILEGSLNSLWKSDKLQKMASQLVGVVSVKNNISINPDEEISDKVIYDQIVTSLQNSVYVEAHRVNINVENGVVTLTGILSSMSEYDTVKEIIKFTKGVIKIKDKLKWVLRYQIT
ncbi:MAG: BON domain-containing protein [Candidatus Thorarchaeota archaeon]